MAALPVAFMIASAAMQAGGEMRQANATAAADRYNANVADQNAQITLGQGQSAVEAQGRDAQRKIGAAVAAYGASGVQMSTGSPMDVLADSARSAALDSLTLRYNYGLKARGYTEQATLDRFNADNAIKAGEMSASGSLLRGGMNAYTSGGSSIPKFGG